ncbi:MAG: hypothetical protein CSA34_04985 [Desulfobulbus propionicus]|nr:MAG: hypothetical protein CSA34_04985 [Desulfobulbus propionicus]
MLKRKPFNLAFPLIVLLLLPGAGQAAQAPARNISVTLPAEALHSSLNSLLPLPLEIYPESIEGQIWLTSIERLHIHENTLSMDATIDGRDLSVNTDIGGQRFKLKLGQLRLPVSCDLLMRYDREAKALFITPKLLPITTATNDPLAVFAPLLERLGNREYPIPMDQFAPFNARIGNQQIPLQVMPVKIVGVNNALVLTLQPITRVAR